MRLQAQRISGVQVPVEVGQSFVTDRNCVVERRGGEQREVKTSPQDNELDSASVVASLLVTGEAQVTL